MRSYRLIDADCHTLEPKHIWTTYLPKKFHDQAPKLVKDPEGGDAWQFTPGGTPMQIGLVTTPGKRFEEMKWTGSTWRQMPGAAVQASVGSAANVWVVNAAGNVFKWNGAAWDAVTDAGLCKAVAVAADGTVLVIRSSDNTVYRKP